MGVHFLVEGVKNSFESKPRRKSGYSDGTQPNLCSVSMRFEINKKLSTSGAMIGRRFDEFKSNS